MVRVTRNYRFSASHRLHLANRSDEENQRLFGRCNNPHGHGHNYVLGVTVEGPIDASTGVAVDQGKLDEFVHREIIALFDHTYINMDVEPLREVPATTENIAFVIERRLQAAWPWTQPRLAHIRVEETKRNVIELDVINFHV